MGAVESERAAHLQWSEQWIGDAKRELGPQRWMLVNLIYSERLSHREIARHVGMSESWVKAELASSMRTIASIISGLSRSGN